MAEEVKRKFERGDFLKKTNKKGSFMIYEGNNLSETGTYKRMSLVCYYDPESYQMGDFGYESKPNLEVASKYKPCTTTLDTEEEDYWVHICDDREKEEAMNVLATYGLYWNEEDLELIHIETGEIIRKVVVPDNKYYGQLIKPMGENFKKMIKRYCDSKIKPLYYSQHYGNGYYED